jgi:hypothetical protein
VTLRFSSDGTMIASCSGGVLQIYNSVRLFSRDVCVRASSLHCTYQYPPPFLCVCTHIMYALYIRTKQRIDALIRLQPLTLCRDTTPFFVCIHTHHPLCVYTHITARPFAHMIQLYRISRFSSRSRTSRSVSHNIVSPPQPYLYKSTPHCNISYTI